MQHGGSTAWTNRGVRLLAGVQHGESTAWTNRGVRLLAGVQHGESTAWTNRGVRLQAVGLLGYRHLTVNYALNFVDPNTGACTNHVKCYWKNAKMNNKREGGTARTLLDSYLIEYMWRNQFGGNPLQTLFQQVREAYPTD